MPLETIGDVESVRAPCELGPDSRIALHYAGAAHRGDAERFTFGGRPFRTDLGN